LVGRLYTIALKNCFYDKKFWVGYMLFREEYGEVSAQDLEELAHSAIA